MTVAVARGQDKIKLASKRFHKSIMKTQFQHLFFQYTAYIFLCLLKTKTCKLYMWNKLQKLSDL